jgi:hypothetical protein
MALLDEQLVEEWLNSNNFFTIRGIKHGNTNEIDLLACRNKNKNPEYWHVEVQVSYSPVAFISNSNARKRTIAEVKGDISSWVEKKFTSKNVTNKRNSIVPNVDWKFVFVHGVVKDSRELNLIRDYGVEIVSYDSIISELIENNLHKSSSTALSIIDLIKHIKKEK